MLLIKLNFLLNMIGSLDWITYNGAMLDTDLPGWLGAKINLGC